MGMDNLISMHSSNFLHQVLYVKSHLLNKGSRFRKDPQAREYLTESVQLPYVGLIWHWQKMTSGVGVDYIVVNIIK